MSTGMPAEPEGFEVVSGRVFAAPLDAVYEAFSDPERLRRWWGPKGFTNRFEAFDLRPGGAWRLVMRGPDGTEFRMSKEFLEVVPPERIALRHLAPTHRFEMTMTFAHRSGGTEVVWRMIFPPGEEDPGLRDIIAAANEENFDRLEALLAGTPGGR